MCGGIGGAMGTSARPEERVCYSSLCLRLCFVVVVLGPMRRKIAPCLCPSIFHRALCTCAREPKVSLIISGLPLQCLKNFEMFGRRFKSFFKHSGATPAMFKQTFGCSAKRLKVFFKHFGATLECEKNFKPLAKNPANLNF